MAAWKPYVEEKYEFYPDDVDFRGSDDTACGAYAEYLVAALCDAIKVDIVKTENKAAQARVRKATLNLEKLGKIYRKETCKK